MNRLGLKLDLDRAVQAPGLDELVASLRQVREGGVDASGAVEAIVEAAPPGKIDPRCVHAGRNVSWPDSEF
jgi:hypothetical protein